MKNELAGKPSVQVFFKTPKAALDFAVALGLIIGEVDEVGPELETKDIAGLAVIPGKL